MYLERKYKDNFLHSKLKGYVSRLALSFIFKEAKLSKTFDFAKKDCGFVNFICFNNFRQRRPRLKREV